MSWAITAVVGGTAAGVGGGYLMSKGQKDPEWRPDPEYPEAKGAREDIWKRLQEWGMMPGYGAIAPNWEDIWQTAQNKVRQYYWGSATSPGAISKVRASAARRNVSESPALEKNIARMGVEEGQQLGEMATQQATEKAAFSEQGRQNWMNQMMGLSQMSPRGGWVTPRPSESAFWGSALKQVGGAASSYGMQKDQQKWLADLIEKTKADK